MSGETPSSSKPEYAPHPFTAIFPPMSDEERKALEESIKKNGLREPITVNPEKQILDGVNRYRACQAVGAPPRFETRHDLVTDEAIRKFIADRNAIRRHLKTAVRAALAVDVLDGQQKDGNSHRLTEGEAAELFGVHKSSIAVAKFIKRASPDLHAIVRAGGLSINAAEAIAKLEEPERIAKVSQLKALLEAKGPKHTNRIERGQGGGGGTKPNSTTPPAPLSMVGTDPLTGKENQVLQGSYNILLHIARAVPQLPSHLRDLTPLTNEPSFSQAHARELRRALRPLRKVNYDDVVVAVDAAIGHLDDLIKTTDEPDDPEAAAA